MPLPHPQRLSRLQRLPRLRIAHQLSLLLTGAVMLAVLAVGSLTLWNLRSGFGEYTRQRDAHLAGVHAICERLGITHHRLVTDQPLELALFDFLNARRTRGKIVRRRAATH